MSPLGFLDLSPRGPLTRLTQLRKQTFFPPLIHNSPISPLRNVYVQRRHLTVSWKYVRHTFDMNVILVALKKYVEPQISSGDMTQNLQIHTSLSVHEHVKIRTFESPTINLH